MEFDEKEKVEGAHNHNADFADSSYATEEEEEEGAEREEEKEYTDKAAAFLASWGFPPHINSQLQASAPANYPVRSPPPPDVKVSVVSSTIGQPVFSSSKEKGSLFSFSSFYDASGTGSFRGAGHMKVIEVVLRMAAAVFSLTAFCVMSSTREMRVAAGSTFEVKFSDFQAYNYLVALNVVSFVYSSAQVVVVLQSSNGGNSIFASPLRSGICNYFCDEILAFCLFSASSSAATASELSHYGLHNIWPPACSTWKLWMLCSKADAAVVISFFSSFAVIMSSLFSGFYLLRTIALL